MSEATAELGTNTGATLYRQGETIRESVEKILENLLAQAMPQVDTSMNVAVLTEMVNTITERLDTMTVDVSNIGDRVVAIQSHAETAAITHHKIADAQRNQTAILKGIDATVNTFVAWFSPLLNDFHDSAILPTLSKLHGRVDELHVSHMNILATVQEVRDKVDPLIEKLSQSPILRMLGVKDA